MLGILCFKKKNYQKIIWFVNENLKNKNNNKSLLKKMRSMKWKNG